MVWLTLQGGDRFSLFSRFGALAWWLKKPLQFPSPKPSPGRRCFQRRRMRGKVSRNIWLIRELISINRAIFRFFRKIGLVLFDGAPLFRHGSAVPSRSVKKTCRWHVFSVGHIAPAGAFRSATEQSEALSAKIGYAARRPQFSSPVLPTSFHYFPQRGKAWNYRQPTASARSAARKAEDDPNRRHSYQADHKKPL